MGLSLSLLVPFTESRSQLAETMRGLLNTVEFEYGSVDLTASAAAPLARLARLLRRHPSLTASVEGHCGLEPPRSFARAFTRERARAVTTHLARRGGVPASQLRARGRGKSAPRVRAVGPGAATNRRVEVYLITNDGIEFPCREDVAASAPPPRVLPAAPSGFIHVLHSDAPDARIGLTAYFEDGADTDDDEGESSDGEVVDSDDNDDDGADEEGGGRVPRGIGGARALLGGFRRGGAAAHAVARRLILAARGGGGGGGRRVEIQHEGSDTEGGEGGEEGEEGEEGDLGGQGAEGEEGADDRDDDRDDEGGDEGGGAPPTAADGDDDDADVRRSSSDDNDTERAP